MTRRPIIVVCPKTGPTLIADSDHIHMMADYSQIELRLLARLSQSAAIIDSLRARVRALEARVKGLEANGGSQHVEDRQ